MLRAMDSAVAGLRAHQNKMDVIGHNLANVNTFGYKAQTYSFKEAVYQTSTPSTGNASTDDEVRAGGTNAAQYGYGTLMGTIGMDMTASTPTQMSGLTAAINGEGFYMTYSLAPEDGDTAEDLLGNAGGAGGTSSPKDLLWEYTRVGQFNLDSKGYLVDGTGKYVYGLKADPDTGALEDTEPTGGYQLENLIAIRVPDGKKADSVELDALGRVKVVVEGKPQVIGVLAIATFQNPNGLTKSGGSYYHATESDNSGSIGVTSPGDMIELIPGYIEASNVDLAKEFAEMITTHRGFQANSKMITVSDEMLSELVSMKR